MTHFCYVRNTIGRPSQAASIRTIKSRVMPARLFMTGMLLFWSGLIHSQQYLVEGCDSICLPLFSPVPEDLVLGCDADFPTFDIPEAFGCEGAPIANTPNLELDRALVTNYSLNTAFGPGDDWALWLGNFESTGRGASDHFLPGPDGVQLSVFANGTARIEGRVINDTDADQQFDLDLFLQYGQDHNSWTAQGRLPKDDLGLEAYFDWTYFEVVDTLSRLEGAGAYEGDVLYLDHMPVTRMFGFQLGADGANNRNTNFGISGWFWYRGTMDGNPVTGTGDVNADLTGETIQNLPCPAVESVERHALAWSECGHHLVSYTVERHDLEAPTFVSLPPLASADCTSLPDTATLSEFEVTDDCGSLLSLEVLSDVVDGVACNQQLTRTWRLTDACGNSADTFQVVTLVDTTSPFIFLEDVEILCDDWASYTPETPIFTDNCTPDQDITWTMTEGDPQGNYPSDFTIEWTYTATDLCGNSTTQSAIATIIDTVQPQFTEIPEAILLTCDEWNEFVVTVPAATDNCDEQMAPATVDTTILEGDCTGHFFVELLFQIQDAAGNENEVVQTIEVSDNTAPVFSFIPEDITINCGEPLPTDMAVASDNCSTPVTVEVSSLDSIAGDCPSNWTVLKTFVATDACGNSATVQQTVTIVDTEGPILSLVPADTIIACGAPLPTGMPSSMDACGAMDSLWSTLDTLTIEANPCPVVARYRRNFYGIDLCGNESSSFQIVEVIDTVAPVIENVPSDTLISCGLALPSHNLTVSDNCSAVVLDTQIDTLFYDCPGSFTLIRSFIATDGCGNVHQEQQSIEVVDNTPPVADTLPELTITCDEELPSALPTAEDDCSNPVLVELFSVDSVMGDCPQAWEVTRTFLATDACGNSALSSQLIHVVDTVAPVLVLGLDSIALECGTPLPMNLPTYADACDIMVNVVELVPDTLLGVCPGEYTVIRHFEATDACGNTSSTHQIVFFLDTVAPELDNIPGPVTIQCDQELPTDLPTAIDDCSGPVTIELFSVDSIQGDCPQAFEVTRTFRATDACGNQIDATQLVTVVDTIAPEIGVETVPEDAFFSCAEAHPTCSDFDVLAFDQCGATEVSCEVDTLFTECPATFTLEMTFTATDECENAASVAVYFDVADTTAPALDLELVPANDTIQCGLDPDLLESSDFSVVDDCSEWTFAASREASGQDENPCDYTLTDTYTFTDCDGNQTVFVHTLTVIDTEGPSMSTAFDSQGPYFCAFEVQNYDMPIVASMVTDDYPFNQVTDNCASQDDIIIDYTDSILVDNGENNYTVQRKWILTDHCDNKTEVIQVIIVEEPALILPNAFSPGNNNYNDLYVIENVSEMDDGETTYPPCDWGPSDQQHFMVFNRWGNEVFSLPPGQPYRNNWDGRGNNGETLVNGTYFVLLRLGDRKLGQYVDLRNDQ